MVVRHEHLQCLGNEIEAMAKLIISLSPPFVRWLLIGLLKSQKQKSLREMPNLVRDAVCSLKAFPCLGCSHNAIRTGTTKGKSALLSPTGTGGGMHHH